MTAGADHIMLEDRLSAFLSSKRAARGPRAAIFLTFQFDGPEFIRRLWRPILLRRGFSRRNCGVMMDAAFPLHAPLPAGEAASAPRLCRVAVRRGCFHPKLAVVVVGSEWFIHIGSANLSRGGLGRNLELAQSFDSLQQSVRLASDVRSFLEALRNGVVVPASNDPWKDGLIAKVVRALPNGATNGPGGRRGPRLLHSLAEPLLDQMKRQLAGAPIRYASMMSPLHCPGEPGEQSTAGDAAEAGGILRRMEAALKLDLSKASLLTDFRGGKPFRPAGAAGLSIYWRDRKKLSEEDADLRPLHAKLFQLRVKGGWHAFWGSANLTEAALARTPAGGGNVELLVHEFVPGTAVPLRPTGFSKVAEFGPYRPDAVRRLQGPSILAAVYSSALRSLSLEWSSEPRGRLELRTPVGRTVSRVHGPSRLTVVRTRRALTALGFAPSEAPSILNYRIGDAPERWIEVQVEGALDDQRQAPTLEDDVLEILGFPPRRQAVAEGDGSPAGADDGGDDLHDEAAVEAGIGFTEHDGALLGFFRRWRAILRRLLELRAGRPDLYEAYIVDVLRRVNRDAKLDSGRLAFLLDCLTRPMLRPEDAAARNLLRALCRRLEGEEQPLAGLAAEWAARMDRP